MKRLTLRKAFSLCREQWEWLVGEIRMGSGKSVYRLKDDWICGNNHGIGDRIECYCFFCEYSTRHCGKNEDECNHCPGRLIDPEFNCCNKAYSYCNKPLQFHAKIVELEATFLKRKAAIAKTKTNKGKAD